MTDLQSLGRVMAQLAARLLAGKPWDRDEVELARQMVERAANVSLVAPGASPATDDVPGGAEQPAPYRWPSAAACEAEMGFVGIGLSDKAMRDD